MAHELVAIGRTGVDIHPLDHGVGLEQVRRFDKFLGGSATNVAVAAARHGRDAALITRVGRDPFGRYVQQEATRLGVDATFITPSRRRTDRPPRSPSARSSRPTTSRSTSTDTPPHPTS